MSGEEHRILSRTSVHVRQFKNDFGAISSTPARERRTLSNRDPGSPHIPHAVGGKYTRFSRNFPETIRRHA